MDDAQRWMAVAADVLAEPDPEVAEHLLAHALQSWGRAYLAVRTVTGPAPRREEVALFPDDAWQESPDFGSAVAAAHDHPLYAYNAHTLTDQPATLLGVMARGWALSEQAAHLMDRLGFTRHQLTIPLAVGSAGGRDNYGLVSESAYTEADLAEAAQIQRLVAGLDAHVQALARAARRARGAPDPTAVYLTPRERIVLDHLNRGGTVEGLAARLSISPRTVHKHQEHLYRKLGAVDRLSAVLSAQRLGLVGSPEP